MADIGENIDVVFGLKHVAPAYAAPRILAQNCCLNTMIFRRFPKF